MLVILDMLAAREYSWGMAGCAGRNSKAKLERKASPVLILSKRNMRSLELTVYDAKANTQDKQDPFGEDAEQADAEQRKG